VITHKTYLSGVTVEEPIPGGLGGLILQPSVNVPSLVQRIHVHQPGPDGNVCGSSILALDLREVIRENLGFQGLLFDALTKLTPELFFGGAPHSKQSFKSPRLLTNPIQLSFDQVIDPTLHFPKKRVTGRFEKQEPINHRFQSTVG